jgi:hypothetical protein
MSTGNGGTEPQEQPRLFSPLYAVAHVQDGVITRLVAGPFVAEADACRARFDKAPVGALQFYEVVKSDVYGWWTL